MVDLDQRIKNISRNEIKTEKPYEIVDAVAEILEFNRRNQKGQALKILIPKQMLSRLPISLAQLKAANNSEKLKNEIRQLLYSLCRSKKLSKKIYYHLFMNTLSSKANDPNNFFFSLLTNSILRILIRIWQ